MANRVLIGKKIKEYFSEASMSQQEVAKVLNVQQAAVSNQLNGRPFGKNSAAKWNKAFGFRINWLLTGEGAMFDDTECGRPDEVLPKDCHEAVPGEDIPVIPARLFRVPDLNIYEYVTTSPTVDRMPSVPHFQKHDLFARCPGDAMAPRICRGYLLALRRIAKDSTIINGEIYAVDTFSQGMFIRKIVDNGDKFMCIAENQADFPDFELPREDVIDLYRVVGVLIVM